MTYLGTAALKVDKQQESSQGSNTESFIDCEVISTKEVQNKREALRVFSEITKQGI